MLEARVRSIRIMAATLMTGLVFITIALALVLPDLDSRPSWLVPAGLVVAGVVDHLLIETMGYRVPALKVGETDPDISLTRYQGAMMLRFALAEGLGIIAVALSFVVSSGGFVVLLVGVAISLALLAFHVWPWRRPVDKIADRLEAEGQPTPLRSAFGYADNAGAVQRL